MPEIVLRTLALAIALGAATTSLPAKAQVADEVVLEILRQCARIDDAGARLACFDNNIRSAGGPARNTVPGQPGLPSGGSAPLASSGATGFGREDVRGPERFRPPAGEAEGIVATVAAVAQREPGIYLITLDDGAQWLFSQAVGQTYRPPRPGSTVSIDRAAVGSFLLRFDQQQSVRVRRVR